MSVNDIPVSNDFQPVPGMKYDDETVEPTEPKVEEPKVEETPESTVEPEKTETPAEPAEPVKVERSKPKPIATLLEKKHEAETKAEELAAKNAELEAQIAELSQAPQTSQNIEDVKQLAEAYGMDENILSDIIKVARKGTELPPEVQNLIAERQAEKLQAEEQAGFNIRVDSLAKALPNEQFSDPKVREKLLELAYSTEKAPDGEPYFKKELSELYFAYIKPEIEPGTVSAESSQGGTGAAKVVDFEEIYNRDDPKEITNMDSETFTKYNTWVKEHKEKPTPIQRS